MVSINSFRQVALSFPGTIEQPHFEKTSFRTNKKIFSTLQEKEKRAFVKLSPIDQSVFCSFDKQVILPVPGGWGRQGWTQIELKKIKTAMLKDILTTAWCGVAPKKLMDVFLQKK